MPLHRSRSLRSTITAASLGVAVLALVLSCGSFAVYQWQESRAEELERFSTTSRVVASSLSAAVTFNDASAANGLLAALEHDASVRWAILTRPDGGVFASYVQDESAPLAPGSWVPSGDSEFRDNVLLIANPLEFAGEKLGTLYIGAGMERVEAALLHALKIFAGVLLLGGLIAFIFASRLSSVIAEPILALSRWMNVVSAKEDYSVRAEVTSNDEVGALIVGFNNMLSEIERREGALRSYREDLERTVASRTRELTEEVLERTRAEEALRREREQLRGLISNSPVAIAMFNTNSEFVAFSQRWVDDYGLAGQPIEGKALGAVLPNLPERLHEVSAEALKGNRYISNEELLESKDGKRMFLRWAVEPWYRPDLSQGGFIMVTDRIDALVEAREEAVRVANMRSQFLANMSHELRTPLNGIIGFTELILAEKEIEGEPRNHLSAIRASGEILLSIINDVLDFSKIEHGKIQIESEPFSVESMIESALLVVRPQLEQRGLSLSTSFSAAIPPSLLGDAFRIKQVLVNLVSNAIKFTAKGGVSVSVAFEAESSGGVLLFEVHDTGVGIPPDKLELIFEAFTQADGSTTRRFGGTGLGLTISKELVRLMGGAIWAESDVGRGSVFSFTIKVGLDTTVRSAESLRMAKPSTSEPLPSGAFLAQSSLNILVAEDNVLNQKLMRALLDKAGHQVVIAKNGKEAVECAQSQPFDLILMDLHMPVMGGVESVMELRRLKILDTVPVVALTADAQDSTRQECQSVGMEWFLTKPIQREALLAVLNDVSARRLSR